MTICLVVLGHVLDGYNRAGNWGNCQMIVGGMISTAINIFHMPLFFMISGYVFGMAYIEAGVLRKQHVKYQMFNLAFLYVMFSVLYAEVKIVSSPWVNTNISWGDIILIPVILVFLRVNFVVFMRLFYKQSITKMVIVSFGCCMLYSILGVGKLGFEITLKKVIYYTVYFLVGYAFQQSNNFLSLMKRNSLAIGRVGRRGGMFFLLLNEYGFFCFSEIVVRLVRPLIALQISMFFVLLFYSKWRKSGILA